MSPQPSFRDLGGSAAENYDRYFVPAISEPVSEDLLAAARIQPGERVVDVACGTGTVTVRAAEQVGASGSVVGTDVSPEMLDVARANNPGSPIDWRQGDATALPVADESFDVALCQMGLMFVGDKRAALSEMRRALVSGGRAALNTPGPIQPPLEILGDGLARNISADLAGFVHVVFSMHDPDEVASLLGDAGFVETTAESRTAKLRLPEPAAFLWQYVASTPLGSFVAAAPVDARARLEEDVVTRWQEYADDGELRIDQPMVVATGRR